MWSRVCALLTLMLGLNAAATRAQAPLGSRAEPRASTSATPLRVLMLLDNAHDEELLTRVRGQTSDLPVVLGSLGGALPSGSGADSVSAAFALCASGDADAIIWSHVDASAREQDLEEPSASSASKLWIALATCSDRRLFAREVEVERPALELPSAAASGALEAAALVLRSALSVLCAGGSIGVQAPSAPPAPVQVEPVRATEPVPSAAPAASAVPRVYRWAGALALQEAWDGAAPAGQPALLGLLALGGALHQLGVTGGVGLPIEHRDAYTIMTLARHSVALSWRVRVLHRGPWRMRWGVDAGSALYQRSIQARVSSASPRAGQLAFAPFVGTLLEAQRKLGPVWLALGAGCDVILRIPRFVYQTPTQQLEALPLWPLVPRILLALAWESP